MELGRKSTNAPIYAWSGDLHDTSRWLTLAKRADGTCVMHLSGLCGPECLGRMSSVSFSIDFLRTATRGGTYQINLPSGYLLIRRQADKLSLEFGRPEEDQTTAATFLLVDLLPHLGQAEPLSACA